MTLPLGPITVSPGTNYKITIQNPGLVQAVKFSNGTQFDLTATGYGLTGQSIIPAGMEYMLYQSDNQQGFINILPVDNLGVGGQGVINATGYLVGEELPKGSWPVTIPAQRVIAASSGGAVVADHLINQGNVGSGSPIISIRQSGATGDNINADNQGNFFVQDYVSSVLTTIFRVIAGGAAGTPDVLIGDTNRQIQLNGQTHARSRIWADSEMTISDTSVGSGGGSNVVTNIQMFNNNDRGIEILPNGGLTGFTGVQVDSSGTNANGIGFTASVLNIGAYLNACFTGLKFDGLQTGGCIDMSGTTATSAAPNIHCGPSPVSIQPDASAFSTVNGSVSGVCNLYTAIWGAGLKLGVYQMLSNYQTAVAQSLLFPSAIQFGFVYSGSIGPNTNIQFNNGGVAAAMRHVLTIGTAGAAGTDEAVSNIKQLNLCQFGLSDRLVINTTGGNNINSFGWFIGL